MLAFRGVNKKLETNNPVGPRNGCKRFHPVLCYKKVASVAEVSYCWWKKSRTFRDILNLVNNGINYISTGAGFSAINSTTPQKQTNTPNWFLIFLKWKLPSNHFYYYLLKKLGATPRGANAKLPFFLNYCTPPHARCWQLNQQGYLFEAFFG